MSYTAWDEDEIDNTIDNSFITMCDVLLHSTGIDWDGWSNMSNDDRNKYIRNMKINTILENS